MVTNSKLEDILLDSSGSTEKRSKRTQNPKRSLFSGFRNSIAAYVATAMQAITPVAPATPIAIATAGAVGTAITMTARDTEAHPEQHFDAEWQQVLQYYRRDGFAPTQAAADRFTRFINNHHDRVQDFSEVTPLLYRVINGQNLYVDIAPGTTDADCLRTIVRSNFPSMSQARFDHVVSAGQAYARRSGEGACNLPGYDPASRSFSHELLEQLISAYLLFRAPEAPVGESTEEHARAPCGPRPACSDGIDNDGDGAADHEDRGCYEGDMFNPQRDSEVETHGCSDGIDNDGDGDIDYADRNCYRAGRFNPEGDEIPAAGEEADEEREDAQPRTRPPLGTCSDGIDNDGDGNADHLDRGCYEGDMFNPQGEEEAPARDEEPPAAPPALPAEECSDREDNDGDGYIDNLDRDCYENGRFNPALSESPRPRQCDDGEDNDGDGDIDYADGECYTPDGIFHPEQDSESRAPAGPEAARTIDNTAEPEEEREPVREETPRGPRTFAGGVGFQGALHASDTPLDWYQADGQLFFLNRGDHGLLDVVMMYGLEEMDFTQAMELGSHDVGFTSHTAAGIIRYNSEPFTLELAGGWVGTDASSGFSTSYGPTGNGSDSERVTDVDPETGEEVVIGDQHTDVISEGTHDEDTDTPFNPDWFTAVEGRFRLTNGGLFLRAGATVFGSRYEEHNTADSHDLNTTDTVYDSVNGFDPTIHVERTDRTATDTHVEDDSGSSTIGGGGRLGMGGNIGGSNVTLEGDIVVTYAGTEGAVDATTDSTVTYTGGHEVIIIDGERDEGYFGSGTPNSESLSDHGDISDAVTVVNPSVRVTWASDTVMVAGRAGVPISIENRLEHVTDVDEEGHEVPVFDTDEDGNRSAVMEENTYVHVPEWAVTGYVHAVGVTPTFTWGAGALLNGRRLTLSGLVSTAGNTEDISSSPWAAHLTRAYESELLGLAPDHVRRESLASSLRHIIASQPGLTGMLEFSAEAVPGSDPEDGEGDEYAFGARIFGSYLGQTESGSRFGVSLDAGLSGNPGTGDVAYDAALNFLAGRGGFYFVGGPFVAGDTEVSGRPIVGGQLYFMVLPDELFGTHTTTTADEPVEEPEEVAGIDDHYETF